MFRRDKPCRRQTRSRRKKRGQYFGMEGEFVGMCTLGVARAKVSLFHWDDGDCSESYIDHNDYTGETCQMRVRILARLLHPEQDFMGASVKPRIRIGNLLQR